MSPRRFPDEIVRRRETPGHRDPDTGEWVEGITSESTLRASVQPLSLEDDDVREGSRYSHRLRVYVPQPDALAAAFEDADADTVLVDDLEYEVLESVSWRGSHTRAILLRHT